MNTLKFASRVLASPVASFQRRQAMSAGGRYPGAGGYIPGSSWSPGSHNNSISRHPGTANAYIPPSSYRPSAGYNDGWSIAELYGANGKGSMGKGKAQGHALPQHAAWRPSVDANGARGSSKGGKGYKGNGTWGWTRFGVDDERKGQDTRGFAPGRCEVTPIVTGPQLQPMSIQKHDRVVIQDPSGARSQVGIVLSVNKTTQTANVKVPNNCNMQSNHFNHRGTDWNVQCVHEGLLRRVDSEGRTLPAREQPQPSLEEPLRREAANYENDNREAKLLSPEAFARVFAENFRRHLPIPTQPTNLQPPNFPDSPVDGRGGHGTGSTHRGKGAKGGGGKGSMMASPTSPGGRTDEAKWARWQAQPWTLGALSGEFITRRYKKDPEATLEALMTAAKDHMRKGQAAQGQGSQASTGGDDLSLVEQRSVVSLVDPLSRCRIALPVRGKACRHVACFDLRTHVAFCCEAKPKNGSKKPPPWRCPVCHGSARWNELEVDQLQLEALAAVPNTTREIFVLGDQWSEKPFSEGPSRGSHPSAEPQGSHEDAKAPAEVIDLGSDDEVEGSPRGNAKLAPSPKPSVIDPDRDASSWKNRMLEKINAIPRFPVPGIPSDPAPTESPVPPAQELAGGGQEVIDLVSSDDDEAPVEVPAASWIAPVLETCATIRPRPVVLSDDDDNCDVSIYSLGKKRQRIQDEDDNVLDPAWLRELD